MSYMSDGEQLSLPIWRDVVCMTEREEKRAHRGGGLQMQGNVRANKRNGDQRGAVKIRSTKRRNGRGSIMQRECITEMN